MSGGWRSVDALHFPLAAFTCCSWVTLFSAQKGCNSRSPCLFQLGDMEHTGVSDLCLHRSLQIFHPASIDSTYKKRAFTSPWVVLSGSEGERLWLCDSRQNKFAEGESFPGTLKCPKVVIIQGGWKKRMCAFHTHLESCRNYCDCCQDCCIYYHDFTTLTPSNCECFSRNQTISHSGSRTDVNEASLLWDNEVLLFVWHGQTNMCYCVCVCLDGSVCMYVCVFECWVGGGGCIAFHFMLHSCAWKVLKADWLNKVWVQEIMHILLILSLRLCRFMLLQLISPQ